MNLHIIGNGFDLAHSLPTTYADFRNYLEKDDWSFLVELEAPYDCMPESDAVLVYKRLWKDFESSLSTLNDAAFIDAGTSMEMGLEIEDIGIEDTLDEYWESQYGYIKQLNDKLTSWIGQIDISAPPKTSQISLSANDCYLSFNYTLVLEEVYKIESYNILHIHGSLYEDDIPPIIGHGDYQIIQEAREQAHKASEGYSEKESSIYNALAKYYERTFKDVNYHIFNNNGLFNKLQNVNQIFVAGHSFGDVDLPYFRQVLKSIKENAIWNIFYYSVDESNEFEQKAISIGILERNIRMLPSSDYFNLP